MAVETNQFKTTVIGLGGAGCKIVGALNSMEASEWLQLAAIDTDSSDIEASGLEKTIILGTQWSYNEGCGGDLIKGERAVSSMRDKLKEFIQDSSLLIVAGGLGGGCCSGGAPVLGRIANECGVPAIFIMTIPFMFEGQVKLDIAEKGISRLLVDADIVLPIPNDILFTSISSDSPTHEAFRKSYESIAETAFGIAEIMRNEKLLSADFADLRTMVFRKQSVCGIATGESSTDEGGDRCALAVERLITSPLLGGKKTLKDADAMLVTVVGGDDFTIGEMKQTLDTVRNLSGDDTIITAGVNSDAARNGKLLITVIVVKCEELQKQREALSIDRFQSTVRSTGIHSETEHQTEEKLFQPEWEFQSFSRGYFSSTSVNPVKVDGEEVDIPTFQRQNITIDKGV